MFGAELWISWFCQDRAAHRTRTLVRGSSLGPWMEKGLIRDRKSSTED